MEEASIFERLSSITTIASAYYALRFAWYWHSSTEIMSRFGIAGLSDGHDTLRDVVTDGLQQNAMIARAAKLAMYSAILLALALLLDAV